VTTAVSLTAEFLASVREATRIHVARRVHRPVPLLSMMIKVEQVRHVVIGVVGA
jgi:hypothetical protein